MESITLQYPSWYIFLCILAGLAFAAALYYRDKTFSEQSERLNRLLGVIRFVTVTFIALLLLQPLIRSIISETKKPVIVLAQDVSESVGAEMNEEAKASYQESFRELSRQLGEKYEVRQYGFGSDVREGAEFEFTDKSTDLASLLRNTYDLYSNQNLGAVIIASDGIYNEGSNPVYSGVKLNAPVYTIALGDTTAKKDLLIKRVFNNKIVYLGDRFSIQIDVAAINCSGTNTSLSVMRVDGERTVNLKQENLNIGKEDFFATREIILEADRAGVQHYRIALSQVQGEATTANNVKDIFIDVLDARQKILILANAPHPDVTSIRQSLETSKNYEVTTALAGDRDVNPKNFDFVILHQVPSRSNAASGILQMLNTEKIPRLYIVGMQSDYTAINNAQPFVTIQADGRNMNEIQASVAGDFNLFTISEEVRNGLLVFAPLVAPFGDIRETGNGQTLLYQRIGKVDTEYPLLTLGESDGIRTGVLTAEGLYRWRLFDYLQHQNHDIFDEIVSKSVQYLSIKEDKRKFRITLPKNIFNENEPVVFDAELYNDNYELINEPDISLVIRNEEGKEFPFTMNKSGNTYNLNAGIFPTGNYSFHGAVTVSGKQLTYDGQFSVQPIQLESYATTADHGLLRLLSEEYGGELVYPAGMGDIPRLLEEKNTVKPVIYTTSKTRSVINLKWIFFLLLGLLSLEWFLRRYFGAY